MSVLSLKTFRKHFSNDLIAGLTVAVLLVPQGMAYAMLAGLPPIYGLYTGMITMIIYPLLGSSFHANVGPTAVISLMTLYSLSGLAEPFSDEYIELAISLALISGVLLFLFGLLRFGNLARVISHPVIIGFTNAAAVLIIVSQLKYILGLEINDQGSIISKVSAISSSISESSKLSILIGVISLIFLRLIKKYDKRIPGSLIVVVIGMLLTKYLALDSKGLSIIKDIPAGMPSFSIPSEVGSHFYDLFLIALLFVLVGFMESFAIAKTIASKSKNYEIDPKKELLGLGAANVISSFFKGMPSTSSFGRSALSFDAGGKTGWTSVFCSIIVAIVLLCLTPYFYYLPKTILGAIIITAVFRLINIKEIKETFSACRSDGFIILCTMLITIFVSIKAGIFTGIGISFLVLIIQLIQKGSLNRDAILPKEESFKSFTSLDNGVLSLLKPLNYLNAGKLALFLKKDLPIANVKSIKLNGNCLDSTASEVIQNVFPNVLVTR